MDTSSWKPSKKTSTVSLFSQGRVSYNTTGGSLLNEEVLRTSSNVMTTKRKPIILKRSGRSSWPVLKNRNNERQNGRGSAPNTQYERRDSFLYRSGSIKSRFQNRHNSTKSSVSYHENDDIEIVITPYAQILLTLKFVKETLKRVFQDKKKTKESTGAGLEIQSVAMETVSNLEWCLYQLENIQTRRSVSNLATNKFKQLLSRELSQHASSITNLNGLHISQYICQTFTDESFLNEESGVDMLDGGPRYSQDNSGCCIIQELEQLEKNEELYEEKNWSSNEDLLDKETFEEPKWTNSWNTDIFELATNHSDGVLYYVVMEIIQERNLIGCLGIDPIKFSKFVRRIESNYNSSIPYHNSLHAADVTISVNSLLSTDVFKQDVFSEFEIFSMIFAAFIHDVGHPGVTNQFLVNTNDKLAILYNDISVLENHHLATAFSIATEPDCLFYDPNTFPRKPFRRMVIDMVLATDMSKHMTILADLKTTVETKKVSGVGILSLDNYNDRIQIMQSILHCADLSNPTKPLQIYLKWTNKVMEEFFQQGDREKQLGLDISPMCDRQNASVPQSQVSFIDFIVYPLWETWSELILGGVSEEMLSNLSSNRAYYQNLISVETNKTD